MKINHIILICINIILIISAVVLTAYYFPACAERNIFMYDASSLKAASELHQNSYPESVN
jgi:hypothetical protein